MKFARLLCLTLLWAVLTACGPSIPDKDRFEGEVGGLNVALQFPAAWVTDISADEIHLATNAGLLDRDQAPLGGARLRLFTLPRSAVFSDSLETFIRGELDTLRAAEGLVVTEAPQAMTVAGHAAVTAQLASGDSQTLIRYIVVDEGHNLALIFAEYDADEAAGLEPLIAEIINSIELSGVMQ